MKLFLLLSAVSLLTVLVWVSWPSPKRSWIGHGDDARYVEYYDLPGVGRFKVVWYMRFEKGLVPQSLSLSRQSPLTPEPPK